MSGTNAQSKDLKESTDAILADTQKRVLQAFSIFDHEGNQTVDVRELGTIVRSLNCCPTEGELSDMLAELTIEEDEPTGYIRYDRFEPLMIRTLLERKYRPDPEEKILKALSILDSEQKGYLSAEEMTKYLTEEGEHFTQEEIEEMLSAALDSDKGVINYKEYALQLAIDES